MDDDFDIAMAKKKKQPKGKKPAAKGSKVPQPMDDDFDLAISEVVPEVVDAGGLKAEAEEEANEVLEEEAKEILEEDAKEEVDAAAAFLAAQGLAPVEASGTSKKKKKKKKKKEAEAGVSARGAMIAERLKKQKAEEEAIKLAEEAEQKRVEDLERAEEEERQRILDEKERKKRMKKEKIEKQKKEGTYMTPAQKKKAAATALRLEAMRAAGMVVPDAGVKKKKVVYGSKKKGKKITEVKAEEVKAEEAEAEEAQEAPKEAQEAPKEAQEQEVQEKEALEEESSGDDWDVNSLASDLSTNLNLDALNIPNSDDEEDLMAAEKSLEKQRLRKLGLAREARLAEERKQMQAREQEEEELSRAKQMAQIQQEANRSKRLEIQAANEAARTRDDLRCPIVVIMGHVDTGKTKLLDKIRKTNVQEGEAGGITQQIGATFFERSTLEKQTERARASASKFEFKVPGLLIIDTPGHESFTNLRSRGSSLCDVAILVVDLMHGLEQQTIESLNMLKKKGTPFVVALNKVDRCYAWKACPEAPIREALESQPEGTVGEFRSRAEEAKVQLAEQGINSNIFWEMGDDDWMSSDFVPLVPTSAISGEGVQDVLLLLCQMAQRKLWKQIMWCGNLQCTVLEVKAIDGMGMTVDVIVVNGYLREGDKVVMCTLDGPVVTEIRGLLTPPPSRELRIKSEYIHHKEIKGALGVKLIGNGLEKVMAGTPVLVVGPEDDEEDIEGEVMSDLTKLEEKLSTDKNGVMVQASTLGALEALLQFLREETKPPIPVSSIGIGAIHKKDVTKISVMKEKGNPEYATILAFDVEVNKEAKEYAEEMGVRIFTADIIYHLFDQFTRFMEDLAEKRRQEASAVAVFPSIVKILPQHVFNQKDPIILGVEVAQGILKIGTPLCVPALGGLHIGKVTSIEMNGKQQETARKGSSVAIKIENESNPNLTYGRQFDATNNMYSTLTRASINALKENFKDTLTTEDWRLVVQMKKVFNIM